MWVYYTEIYVSLTYSVDTLLGQIPILLKHILQVPILLNSIWVVSVAIYVDTFLENSSE